MIQNSYESRDSILSNDVCRVSSVFRKKVLLLCTSTYIGGTERVVQTLTQGLSARQINAEMVIPWERDEAARITGTLEWHRQGGVEVTAAPEFSRRNQGWKNVHTLAKFLKSHRDVDIVNIHYTQNTSVSLTDILAIRLAGKKPVVMVHHPEDWSKVSLRHYRIIVTALRLVDAVIGSTECMAKLLRETGINAQKVVTIPLGVAEPVKRMDREQIRLRMGIPPQAFVISTLTRLVAEKGIFELMEAFARMPASPDLAYLIIAGDGPDRAAMECKANELGGERIIFTGKVDDVSEVYTAGDVFALPSYWEGFGLVYVEAAFHGLPSIGTNVGGIPYVIKNEESGLLVPPRDVDYLYQALTRLRDDSGLRKRLGRCAQDRARTEFTQERMAQQFHDLFQNILVKRSSKRGKMD